MEDFILYFKIGLTHVLDYKAYDHILFLIALTVVFNFRKINKVLWLITLFTIGHSITLALSTYNILNFPKKIIEFLIPLTICITALLNIFTARKVTLGKQNLNLFFALFFGLVHGLGFSNFFKMMVGREENKLFPLLEFALGIEIAQIIIILSILILGSLLENLLRVSKRDWILVTSSIVIGFALQMMMDRIFW